MSSMLTLSIVLKKAHSEPMQTSLESILEDGSFGENSYHLKAAKYFCKTLYLRCLTFFCCFYLGFLSRIFTNHRTAGEGGGHFFNSSLPLPPASQTLRHQLGDYCIELTSAHSQQPDSNRESLVSERKSLTVHKVKTY